MRLVPLSIALALAVCTPVAHAQIPPGAGQIKHVVFILKENHTFDNYFGSLPGVDGASTGRVHTGKVVPLTQAPDDPQGDIWHTWHYCVLAMDNGKMDKFDLIKGARQFGFLYAYTQYRSDQLPNYFAYAHQFALADEFFTSVHGPSFPNHL
jgi:phospholipase C